MDLNRMFKINRRSEIVTFDKFSGNSSSSTKEMSHLMTDDRNCTGTTDKFFLKFPSRRWFKDRMGTVYSGYADPRLLSILIDPAKQLTEEQEKEVIVRKTS